MLQMTSVDEERNVETATFAVECDDNKLILVDQRITVLHSNYFSYDKILLSRSEARQLATYIEEILKDE